MRCFEQEIITRYRNQFSDERSDKEIMASIRRVRKDLRYKEYWIFRQVHEGEWQGSTTIDCGGLKHGFR